MCESQAWPEGMTRGTHCLRSPEKARGAAASLLSADFGAVCFKDALQEVR